MTFQSRSWNCKDYLFDNLLPCVGVLYKECPPKSRVVHQSGMSSIVSGAVFGRPDKNLGKNLGYSFHLLRGYITEGLQVAFVTMMRPMRSMRSMRVG
jgi:hypothetical protein